jgi:transcriptional regulator with XRE-family HTH domain
MFNSIPKNKSDKGQILRFMREEKKLSLPTVAQKTGIKASIIDHFENGRRPLTESDIQTFLACYEFTVQNISELMEIKLLNKQAANHYFLKLKSL